MQRRRFLQATGSGLLLSALPGLSFARVATDARLVFVILRGGLDGLAAVPPYGDANYARQRGSLALGSPGAANGALDLDGFFGLHPSLTGLHSRFNQNELLVLHAVATPYRERSHFDGQDVLENGGTDAAAFRDGWLNRALAELPRTDDSQLGIALGSTVPLALRGSASVTSWAPSGMPNVNGDTLARIAMLYESDELLSTRLEQGLAADALADSGGMSMSRGRGGRQSLQPLARAAGNFLAAEKGPRIAMLEATGWDTHANQGVATGGLANRLWDLDRSLELLANSLGPIWQNTVVIVATEFGRTVAVNGTRGTDHGTGAAAFLLGGAVNGGRVLSDWPGLAPSQLYQGRDLRPTIDMRQIFKGVLRDHISIAERQLSARVFPGSNGIAARPGLTRNA
ncbi:MAG: DUF1501 domain-containing protein [Gammaproteobacteria bacterium]|nr:DUF1501 domain-containing protein [Gammaproteobacteria bacterium]